MLDLAPPIPLFEMAQVNMNNGLMSGLMDRWPEDLVIAPVPGYSPTFGWNLAVGGGYFLEPKGSDNEVAPSLLGGFVWVADNGSHAYGLGANLHLLDDRLRIKAGAGFADLRYRYYGIGDENDRGLSIDILQTAPLYFASGTWRLWKSLYAGLGYVNSEVESRVRLALESENGFFDPSLTVQVAGMMIPVQWDSRDHEQFPTRGVLVSGRSMFYRKDFGGDFDADTHMLSANYYYPVGERDVLALRAYGRTTNGDAPFFLLSTFGGSKDLRGYPAGRYRDRMMYALQGEYRRQINEKWIATGFAGFGEVAEKVSEFGGRLLPAAGVGARFVISQKHRVSLSMDIAFGRDGGEVYIGIGEAF